MLSDNDRQRIEQAAKLSWKNTITAFEDSDEISFWEGYLTGAEYATLYERQQQAALKELNRTLYESNERQAVVISEFKQEGSSERARANNAVGKYWEILEANKKLEAEHSELRNKVIEQQGKIDALTDFLKTIRPYVGQISIPHGSLFLKEIKQLLKLP